ncbi:MAG TPA: hypothetical protein VHD33_05845 [Legionellaceae bacterium]|nr:hypothetical protein [Legionellaceae bacterium]
MASRTNEELIKEITDELSVKVSPDAKSTILTIRNLIESNSRVEASIDALHQSITNVNKQNDRLQTRIYYLTIVTVIFTLVQVAGVIVQVLNH